MRFNLIAAVAVAALSVAPAMAQQATFAQFTTQDGSNNYAFTNNGNGTATFSTDSEIYFQFFPANVPSNDILQPLPVGPISATLYSMTTTDIGATCTGSCFASGNAFSQALGSTTVIITDDADDSVLLEINGSASTLTGQIDGQSGNTEASDSTATLILTSAYINFANVVSDSSSVSFTSVEPEFAIDPATGLLESFTASSTGSVAADFSQIPEPSTVTLLLGGVLTLGGARTRRAAKAALAGA